MSTMDLDTIKTCTLRSTSTIAKIFHQLLNFCHSKFMWNLLVSRTWNRRGSNRLVIYNQVICLSSSVINLSHYFTCILMNAFCKLPMSWYLTIIPKSRNPCKSFPFGIHSIVLRYNNSPATFCLCFMIGDKFFCCRPILITVINHHSRYNKTIRSF